MRILNFVFLAFAFLGLQCCKKTNDQLVIDEIVDILLVDEEQNNLLESGILNPDDLEVYYLIDGENVLYFAPNLDYPKGYTIVKNQDNQSVLRVFVNSDVDSPITLIEYNESDTDTIKCDFHRHGASTICTKVWYNDIVK